MADNTLLTPNKRKKYSLSFKKQLAEEAKKSNVLTVCNKYHVHQRQLYSWIKDLTMKTN